MELDSYGISYYFTGNIRDIPIDAIQKITIRDDRLTTNTGEFILQTMLGEGTYGKTYATTAKHGKSYAVKIMDIRNTYELYNTIGEAIMNIILLEGTEHEKDGPYVPRIYEVGVNRELDTAIIRYERMNGTLFDFLNARTAKSNDRNLPDAVLKILNMSEFLESRFQFNHRDFKSDNIMYVLKHGKPMWRIIDLGAACMTWNGFRISSDGVFDSSRPCVHRGRDITFLLTELILDTPITPKLATVLRKLITFDIRGTECELNSTNCKQIGYEKWENIYDILNQTNVINPHYTIIRSTLSHFLKNQSQLKQIIWNVTLRKPKHNNRRTLRHR